jgi:hypothetical protein
MHDSIRLLSNAGLVALSACATIPDVAPPSFRYPPLLHSAGIEGPVRFRVRLDSVGSPQLQTFEIVATYNPGFNYAVRDGLKGWRDSSMAGRIVEHTVVFIVIDTAGTDSIARCWSSRSRWAVCERRVRPTVRY